MRLKEYRDAEGLLQKDFAQLLGVSAANLSRAERKDYQRGGCGYEHRFALLRIERKLAGRPGALSQEVRQIALDALGRGGEDVGRD